MSNVTLQSGLKILNAEDRLLRFCKEEYDYYDGIPDCRPTEITPIDVLATFSVNSRIGGANGIRQIHRDMARTCNPLLQRIPIDADLLSFDPALEQVKCLLSAAMVDQVLVSRATKVLHRKRRAIIPMLDSVVIDHYVAAIRMPWLKGKAGESNRKVSLEVGMTVLPVFREDLRSAVEDVTALRTELFRQGFELSHVRTLEILIWTETERSGYYR